MSRSLTEHKDETWKFLKFHQSSFFLPCALPIPVNVFTVGIVTVSKTKVTENYLEDTLFLADTIFDDI